MQDAAVQISHYESSNSTRRYLHQRRREIVVDMIHSCPRGGLGLEIGVSGNVYQEAMSRSFPNLIRVDIDESILMHSLREDPISPISYGDVTDLPFPNNTYDFILCSEVLEHVDPKLSGKALREMHRVLVPGGYMVLSTPQKFSPVEQLIRVATKPPMKTLANMIYDEPVDDWGHVNLLTGATMEKQIQAAGFSIEQKRNTGCYLPVIAEFGGRIAARIFRWAEGHIERSMLRGILWTQIYLTQKPDPS